MSKKTMPYDIAMSFWIVAFQYLMLVENVARETVSTGNPLGLSKDISNGPITEDEFAEATRWSDHVLVIPLLFNLYHGIELLVKGFALIAPGGAIETKHTIQDHCRKFSEVYSTEKEINSFFLKYTEEEKLPFLLSEFLNNNKLTFSDLYQALRYPSDKNFRNLNNYIQLKYKGERGLYFFQELHDDIKLIRPLAVLLGRSLKPNPENTGV